MNDTYCLYLRKSRSDIEAEARGEGETLERHRRILFDLAKRLNIHISKEYKEIVSGETIIEREVVQDLLRDVEQGVWTGVLVVEVERLARGDTVDQGIVAQTFKYSGTKIITPTKTYDPNNEFDEEYFEFGLFMSRREFKTINRRLQNGRISSVKEGKYVGNKAPYGYDRVKLINEKGYTLEKNERSEIVKLIFDLYCYGEPDKNGIYHRIGTGNIAKKLNLLKIPTISGGPWTVPTISAILRNPVYYGMIKWGSRRIVKKRKDGIISKSRPRASIENMELYKGRHEAIISKETWFMAQEILSKNPAKPVPDKYVIKNPLSGLVVCAKCGRKMVRRPHPGDYPDTLMCQLPRCGNKSSFLYLVEEKIIEGLKQWLSSYKAQWDSIRPVEEKRVDTTTVKRSALTKLEKELETVTTQLDNLDDLLEQGIYTVEKYMDRVQKLKEKIGDINNSIIVVKRDIEQDSKYKEAKQQIIPKVQYVIDTYFTTDKPELRNDLLLSVLNKVVYLKERGGRWHNKPDDFELELHPVLPRHH
ncbi:recombinase family protein [Paenibacillus alvei]|uniref:Recombinase family protein n=1 Tax=Paenibacillus alvei TaxID=44250 RepID=A0ABT4H7W0_PAEAL|nr:recombinase family protein [Paenibacillus alvei]MCY9539248.1 recombinase family protein [Paenibacillus alvei]MCY9705801.1 recombinase family protein [Paenibacillus alvei]MCY9737114.1 recombinase family protein [Paenibacillus alvei]MCY9753504.1 recombinase family protein [Paenibacillus alvei]MCY9765075.1 recombinase family protein [Paenibacillus alvei]